MRLTITFDELCCIFFAGDIIQANIIGDLVAIKRLRLTFRE